VTGVVAMNAAGCIGRGGRIPWHHREDMRLFKRLTSGGTVVMGRKTWDGLPRRPLPRRDHVILTSCPERVVLEWNERDFPSRARPGKIDGPPSPVVRFGTLEALPRILEGLRTPVFVIGGAAVYDALWERIERFVVTWVPDEVDGCDTFFPRPLGHEFALIGTQRISASCTVGVFRRIPSTG